MLRIPDVDLNNYYTKSETYTKTEIDSKIKATVQWGKVIEYDGSSKIVYEFYITPTTGTLTGGWDESSAGISSAEASHTITFENGEYKSFTAGDGGSYTVSYDKETMILTVSSPGEFHNGVYDFDGTFTVDMSPPTVQNDGVINVIGDGSLNVYSTSMTDVLMSKTYTKTEIDSKIKATVQWGELIEYDGSSKIVYQFFTAPTTGTVFGMWDYTSAGVSRPEATHTITFENGEYKSFTAGDSGSYTVSYDKETMILTISSPGAFHNGIHDFDGNLGIDMSPVQNDGVINVIGDGSLNVYSTNIDNFQVGKPVFLSGKAYMRVNNQWVPSKDSPTNCIAGVKTSGTFKEYVGICTRIDKARNIVTFATHGDFYFSVDDTSIYKIGDTILYDGRIINDDMTVNNKLLRMTVGIISAKINQTTLAIFRD